MFVGQEHVSDLPLARRDYKICQRSCLQPHSSLPQELCKTAHEYKMAALEETPKKRDAALDVDQVEDAAPGQHGPDRIHGVLMPDLIACLSGEERDKLERHLRRKIDFRLLPMVICMYILNYIDRYVSVQYLGKTVYAKLNRAGRNNIAAARLAGLEEDLNLNASGTQFSVRPNLSRKGRRRESTANIGDDRLLLASSLSGIF